MIPVCPEQLGGMPTPRPKAEIIGGSGEDVLAGTTKVRDATGKDVTGNFIKGARETLKIVRTFNVRFAVFKDRSPSCGVNLISRNGEVVEGLGVTAALLKREGIKIAGY